MTLSGRLRQQGGHLRQQGDIKNADKKVREKSNNSFGARHRTPIDNDNFWNELNGLINQKVGNQQVSNIITNWLQQNPNIKVTIQYIFMKSVINIIAIIVSLYSLYYQFVQFIFDNLTRSSKMSYSALDVLPEVITILICFWFLIINIRGFFKNIRSK